MLLDLDARTARAEAQAMRGEMAQLGSTVRNAGTEARAGSDGIGAVGETSRTTMTDLVALAQSGEDMSSVLDRLRQAANPLVGEYVAVEQAIRAVSMAEGLGILTAREAALAHDQLSRSMMQLKTAIDAGGGGIAANSRAMVQQETALQTLIARTTGLASATETSVAAQLQHGQALDALRARFDPLFAASRAYEIQLQDIAEAERLGALSAGQAAQARERAAMVLAPASGMMRGIGRDAQQTGFYVQNLGFQLNDIAMMVMMGQSPFMTALQQGSQIGPMFADMSARGQSAGTVLRGAFLSLLNPASLATMAVIAFGGLAVQAFMSASTGAKSFEDQLKELETTSNRLRENSRLLFGDGLSDRFGSLTGQARALTETLVQLDRAAELRQLRDTLETRFGEAVEPTTLQRLNQYLASTSSPQVQNIDLAANNWAGLGTALPFEQFKEMRSEIDALAAEGKVDEVTGKLVDLGKAMAGGKPVSGMSEQAQTLLSDLARLALATAETEAIFNGSAQASPGERRADEQIAAEARALELAQARLTFGEQSAQVRAIEADHARAAVEAEIARLGIDQQSVQAVEMRAQVEERIRLTQDQRDAAARQSAADMMVQWQAEAQIAELTARYGADSLEVAYARAAAEREVTAAQIAAQGITGTTADNLLRAWDAARGIAAVNMAAGIGAAATEARLLAASLGISLQQALGIMGLAGKAKAAVQPRVGFGLPGVDTGSFGASGSLGFGDNPGQNNPVPSVPSTASTGAGTGGGRGGAAQKEVSALDQLIKREREQIALLGILDPVQREIARNHEALSEVVGKERDAVEDLITQRVRLEEVHDRIEEIGQAGKSAFTSLITGASSFRDALGNVLSKLAEMAASDAWDLLWSGGSGRSGAGGLGSVVGGLLGGLFGGGTGKGGGSFGLPDPFGFADGGRISGPGGGRDDSILAYVSDGEYIINARATAAHLPLLDAINKGAPVDRLMDFIGGRAPAFADGGMISGLMTGGSAPAAVRAVQADRAAASASGSGGGAGGTLDVRVYVDQDGNWQAAVERISAGVSSQITQAGIEEWSRKGLPSRVAEVNANPWRSW